MDALTLQLSLNTSPLNAGVSGLTYTSTPLNEQMQLGQKLVQEVELTVDSPVSLSFGGLAAGGANLLYLRVYVGQGNTVEVRITSPLGTTQVFPLDDVLLLSSQTLAFTAITLTRTPGVDTWIETFLGQKA